MSPTQKVVNLPPAKVTAAKRDPHLFPGFSSRLNELIDYVYEDVPPKNEGRYTWLSELVGASKPSASMWLDQDRAPRDETLGHIVNHILDGFKGYKSSNIDRIKTWLLYGEDVIQNPFKTYSDEQLAVLPLALQLVAECVNTQKIKHTTYDFQKLVDATLNLLVDQQIQHHNEVKPQHIKLISGYLKKFS